MVKLNPHQSLPTIQNYCQTSIFFEFYGLKYLNKEVTPATYSKRFFSFLIKFLKNPPKLAIKATDFSSTRTALLLAYLKMRIRHLKLKIPSRNIIAGIKKLLADEEFKTLYYFSCKIIFSLPIKVLSKELNLRCCNSQKHFIFCNSK